MGFKGDNMSDLIDCMMVNELKRKLVEEKEQTEIKNALLKYMAFLVDNGYCTTSADISKELCRITIKTLMVFVKNGLKVRT
jgi:hypothetical protein